MEEKVISVTINNKTIDLKSNNPDIKKLVLNVIEQDDDYDFNSIEVIADDKNFDKDSFKEIIIESIRDFKESTKLVESKYEDTKNEIDKYKETMDDLNI